MANIKSIKYLTQDGLRQLYERKRRLQFATQILGAVIIFTNATLYLCNVYDRDIFALITVFGVASIFCAVGIDIGMSNNGEH